MKQKFKILICLTVFYLATSCSDQNASNSTSISQTDSLAKNIIKKSFPELEKHQWFLGSWHGELSQIKIDEVWTKQNDSTYVGNCIFTKAADTLSFEVIKLMQSPKGLFYIPIVTNQNGGKAIEFILTKSDEAGSLFENPAHDFPQKINYLKKGDSLLVEIAGMQEGIETKQKFPMHKVK